MLNRRVTFARVPQGLPVPEDFSRDTVEAVRPAAGQFLSKTLWLSLDPFLRNVMKGHALYGVLMWLITPDGVHTDEAQIGYLTRCLAAAERLDTLGALGL